MTKIDFTAKGNAVGFDKHGRTITGRKMKGQDNDWVIEVTDAHNSAFVLSNGLRRCFAKKPDAIAYAASLICPAKTTELAWW